jgi:adenosine deaminase CECR1
MMKGLFNYKSAYEEYTKRLLDDFVNDNIQWAEIRPNFMKNNQVLKDNGEGYEFDNKGIMDLIISVFERFREEQKDKDGNKLVGLKVIYCTPRSFPPDQVAGCLQECLEMKRHKKYGPYIAGKQFHHRLLHWNRGLIKL